MNAIDAAPNQTALLVVDLQQGFEDEDYWGQRNNPECERNIEKLVSAFRAAGGPLIFAYHDSQLPESPLRPGQPGNQLHPLIASVKPDLVIRKSVNSCFYGAPDLHAWMSEQRLADLAICGVTTNHCCETTARMAGNLGYRTLFVLDATYTFDREGADGRVMPADQLAAATATSLHEEFAQIVATQALCAAISAR